MAEKIYVSHCCRKMRSCVEWGGAWSGNFEGESSFSRSLLFPRIWKAPSVSPSVPRTTSHRRFSWPRQNMGCGPEKWGSEREEERDFDRDVSILVGRGMETKAGSGGVTKWDYLFQRQKVLSPLLIIWWGSHVWNVGDMTLRENIQLFIYHNIW